MLTRIFCVFLAGALALASLPPPADAQFGVRRTFKKVVRAPARVLPKVAAPVVGGAIIVGGPFRKAFGVVAAVAIGAAIFEHLSRQERREVARRANDAVGKDPNERVIDSFTSNDGRKQVTIVAEPTQSAVDLKNDPAILVAADTVVAPNADGKSTPSGFASASNPATATDAPPTAPSAASKPAATAAKPVSDEEVVRIGGLPPDTQCRRVTTELELRKKKDQKDADEKSTNTAIFCQTAPGKWKPASA
ncbi:hypothetical protein [Hyphomicrobium sp. CS1GBMeth3]|uniref:hypothetical protein n=1 Tax=Hyphomicrobium sp. CS1GBMeth3 TaxID=1892845 RepID=UPI0009316FE0|nr:hypothetical protein [Hyphomicrobium sp. CS1GBMeth3]